MVLLKTTEMNIEKQNSLFLTCDCYSHVLEVQYYDYAPEDRGFYVSIWKHQCTTEKLSWGQRLRWCWILLTAGNLLGDNIILSNEKAQQIVDYINKNLPK